MNKVFNYLESSDPVAKHVKILAFLLISGILGLALGYIAKDEKLAVVFAPAINYALWIFEQEIKK